MSISAVSEPQRSNPLGNPSRRPKSPPRERLSPVRWEPLDRSREPPIELAHIRQSVRRQPRPSKASAYVPIGAVYAGQRYVPRSADLSGEPPEIPQRVPLNGPESRSRRRARRKPRRGKFQPLDQDDQALDGAVIGQLKTELGVVVGDEERGLRQGQKLRLVVPLR